MIGVDWGGTRIGIAVGESEFQVASIRTPLQATGTLAKDAALIKRLMDEEEASLVVVGIPYHDADGRQARVCLQLVDRLKELGAPVATVDESLTTEQSHQDMAEQGLKASQRKQRVDGESAVRILLRYFNDHGT